MPVNPQSFEYQFSAEALTAVREKLGISQAQLSQLLDVPVNTISRWERQETTPDAHSLAAIYSIAKGAKLEPEFFRRRVTLSQGKSQQVKNDFLKAIERQGSNPIRMTVLGQTLKEIMEKRAVDPEAIGISKNHPARSLLIKLQEDGKVKLNQSQGNPESLRITIVGAAKIASPTKTKYFTIERKGRPSFELTVVGKDGKSHVLERETKGKDGHFTDEGQYRRAIKQAVAENSR